MAIHRFVLHNGRIREASESILSPGQLGLLAGWGIFSTLRVKDGVLFAWERHWARMSHDAELLNVTMPPDSETVRRDLVELIEANQSFNASLRLVVVRNGGGMWEGPPTGRSSDVVALTADNNFWGHSVRLTYQPAARFSQSDFVSAKIISWAHNLRWYERAHQRGFDECVLLNELGEITECTSANIFAVHGAVVSTPPVSAGCLPGVTRQVLLEEIHVPGVRIQEQRLRPEDLDSADEVFITSTTRDLLPVAEIDGQALNSNPEVRTELLTAFRAYLTSYIAAHRESYRSADALRS
jgi:branched-chain amino acid aminotransferase